MRTIRTTLWSGGCLSDYLSERLNGTVAKIAELPAAVLADPVQVAAVISGGDVQAPVVEWDRSRLTPVSQSTEEILDDFRRPYSCLVESLFIGVPFSGDAAIFDLHASTSIRGEFQPQGVEAVRRSPTKNATEDKALPPREIMLKISDRSLTAQKIRAAEAELRAGVEKRLAWSVADIAAWRITYAAATTRAVEQRRARLVEIAAMEEELGGRSGPDLEADPPANPVTADVKLPRI